MINCRLEWQRNDFIHLTNEPSIADLTKQDRLAACVPQFAVFHVLYLFCAVAHPLSFGRAVHTACLALSFFINFRHQKVNGSAGRHAASAGRPAAPPAANIYTRRWRAGAGEAAHAHDGRAGQCCQNRMYFVTLYVLHGICSLCFYTLEDVAKHHIPLRNH